MAVNQFRNRRRLIQAGVALPTLCLLGTEKPAGAAENALIECTPGNKTTPRQTAGPFFTPNTPLKKDFRKDDPGGRPFHLRGRIHAPNCEVIKGAMVELWHADSRGTYDNQGYRMRGHQFTDDDGRFEFFTRRPGLYPGRTPHFHITIKTHRGQSLTTQLYFPGEALNARDGIFDEKLLLNVSKSSSSERGDFRFVL